MTFRELMKELESMSIQALNQDVRVSLDGTQMKVYLKRDKSEFSNGLRVETSEFTFDKDEQRVA